MIFKVILLCPITDTGKANTKTISRVLEIEENSFWSLPVILQLAWAITTVSISQSVIK